MRAGEENVPICSAAGRERVCENVCTNGAPLTHEELERSRRLSVGSALSVVAALETGRAETWDAGCDAGRGSMAADAKAAEPVERGDESGRVNPSMLASPPL